MKKNYTVYIRVEKTIPVDVCVESLSTSNDLDDFVFNAVSAAWPGLDKLSDGVFRETEDAQGIKITDDHGSLVWEHHEFQFPEITEKPEHIPPASLPERKESNGDRGRHSVQGRSCQAACAAPSPGERPTSGL